jgi:hypothetical protein
VETTGEVLTAALAVTGDVDVPAAGDVEAPPAGDGEVEAPAACRPASVAWQPLAARFRPWGSLCEGVTSGVDYVPHTTPLQCVMRRD